MQVFGKLFLGIIVLAIAGLLGYFLFLSAYVEMGRNAVATHVPHTVSPTSDKRHDDLTAGAAV